jgi:putative inorganic carbon (hco3(-)) transporter
MEHARKNIVPVIVLLSVYTIPLFFDNSLININTIHFFLFSSILLILCFCLFFFQFSYIYTSQIRSLFITFVLFLLFISISSSVNNRFVLALEDIAIYANVFIFSYLIFLSFQLFNTEKLLHYISFSITIACVLVSLLGILEFFNINLLNFHINSRPGSTLSIRNFASEYSVIALPFIFMLGMKEKGITQKIFSSVSLLIVLSFIFFCRTRSSFVVLTFYFVAVSIYLFYNKFFFERYLKKVYLNGIIILVLAYLIGSFTVPNIDKERTNLYNTVASISDINYPENVARINYWKTSLRIFRDEPVTGVGTGSWFGIYPRYNGNIYNDENRLYTSELNPHNEFLEILSENGIFGFIFFVFFLFLIIKYLYEKTLKNILILPALLSFSGFLILSLFSFPKDNISIMILFATASGISLSATETGKKNELIGAKINRQKTILLITASLILITVTIFSFFRYKYEAVYLNAIKEKSTENFKSMIDKINDINTEIYPVDPNCMPVEYYRGIGYFELKNYSEAMNSFEKALELTPAIPAILNNKASSFYMLNDTENAVKLLLDLKRRNPFLIEPQINLLAIYTNTGQDSLAKILIEDIDRKTIDHQFIRNYNVLGKIKAYYNEKKSD